MSTSSGLETRDRSIASSLAALANEWRCTPRASRAGTRKRASSGVMGCQRSVTLTTNSGWCVSRKLYVVSHERRQAVSHAKP